jgi:pimeloyl-ACP methyl ester carboxylesterase
MPEVFSIYNCGTSYNRQNLDETVADLARRTVGAENRDWMINDGPGSYSHHVRKSATALARGLAAQAKTPGTRDPISGLKEGSAFAVIRGVVSGYGWEHNVDHTMAVLNATLDLPRTINLVGWSRGAITCFMIAHALNENPRTKPIAVNICALDPVPGPGNFHDPEKVTLPANVKNYVAIVEQDERRKIFKPGADRRRRRAGHEDQVLLHARRPRDRGLSQQERGRLDRDIPRPPVFAEARHPA